MRWRGGLEIGHQSELGTLPEVGVLMCALGRCVPELRLNRLDGVTSGRGLAGHRMPTDLMVADLPETERSLHGPQGPRVRVDTRGEAPVLAEQELRTRISFPDVPANRVDLSWNRLQLVGFRWYWLKLSESWRYWLKLGDTDLRQIAASYRQSPKEISLRSWSRQVSTYFGRLRALAMKNPACTGQDVGL